MNANAPESSRGMVACRAAPDLQTAAAVAGKRRMTDPLITYPCFVPATKRGRGEAPHLLVVHGRPCLILLTEYALLAYVRQRYAGQPTVAAAANRFDRPHELLAYLKDVEAPAARQGVFHVALNPSKARTVYGRLRELVEALEKEVEQPA
jgi:hypothetical protein